MTIYTTTLIADNGLTLTCLAGPTGPIVSSGYGGWAVIARPKTVGLTRFGGRNPMRQDISLRFDGVNDNTNQEGRITILERMARQASDKALPPKIRLDGIALRKDLTWVIDDLTFAEGAMWETISGSAVRVRQDVIVHLLQFVDDTVIVTESSPAIAAQSGKKKISITTPKGMTLKQIAALEYPKNPDKGMTLILMANLWLDADPRKVIPAGTILTIPDITTGVVNTFIVP